MQKLTPCLWFDDNAEEVVKFYKSVFKKCKINQVTRYPKGSPGPAGKVMTISFRLLGQDFVALNGGPVFKFTEAVSFMVNCKTQREVDHYWNKLTRNGGKPSQCGWLEDKFGLSWQIVPEGMLEIYRAGGERAERVMQAMLKMSKLDINVLRAAAKGPGKGSKRKSK
jgi:predicted 3-demethylubiquinone-9 3-methyltransferase (glyoxalase superfamily)